MSINKTLEKVVCELNSRNVTYAIAGGIAANVYRQEIRGTQDIDIAIIAENEEQIGREVIESLNLKAGTATKADLDGGPIFKKKQSPTILLVGRDPSNEDGIGVDILLSTIPWAKEAIKRAQDNKFDYGFGSVPTLTIEDLLVAKLYAISKKSTRYKDLDDIQSIVQTEPKIDAAYLSARLKEYKLFFSREFHQYLDPAVGRISRKIERSNKKAKSL